MFSRLLLGVPCSPPCSPYIRNQINLMSCRGRSLCCRGRAKVTRDWFVMRKIYQHRGFFNRLKLQGQTVLATTRAIGSRLQCCPVNEVPRCQEVAKFWGWRSRWCYVHLRNMATSLRIYRGNTTAMGSRLRRWSIIFIGTRSEEVISNWPVALVSVLLEVCRHFCIWELNVRPDSQGFRGPIVCISRLSLVLKMNILTFDDSESWSTAHVSGGKRMQLVVLIQPWGLSRRSIPRLGFCSYCFI